MRFSVSVNTLTLTAVVCWHQEGCTLKKLGGRIYHIGNIADDFIQSDSVFLFGLASHTTPYPLHYPAQEDYFKCYLKNIYIIIIII